MAGNFRSKTFFSDIYVHTKHVSAVIYTFSTHRSTSIHFMGCFDVYEQWKWYTAHTHRNWRVRDLPAGGMASSAFSEVFPSASDRFESSLRHTRFSLLIAHHTSTISNILLTQCHNSSQYFHFLLLLFLIFLIFLLYIFVVGSIFTNKHFVSITLQNQKLINTLRCCKIASMRMLFIGIIKRVLD